MIVASIKTRRPIVALTFDDGPDETHTPLLLDVLAHESALATFFIMGSAVNARSKQIVARMDAAGHDICNHTHSHMSLEGASAETIDDQILRTHHELQEITGRPPMLIRPPYGRGKKEVNRAAERLGYRATVLWTAWGVDWEMPPAETIVKRVFEGYDGSVGIRPGGIVLLHDGCAPERAGDSRMATVDAVRLLIPRLRDAGFTLVTVSELLDAAGIP